MSMYFVTVNCKIAFSGRVDSLKMQKKLPSDKSFLILIVQLTQSWRIASNQCTLIIIST